MKTTFGRLFFTMAAVILFGMVLLGTSFGVLIRNYLFDEKESSLRTTAQAVAKLAEGYQTGGMISGKDAWSLRAELSFSAEVTKADAFICSATGEILMCSCESMSCEHLGMAIDKTYLEKVFAKGYFVDTGVISGLDQAESYVVSVPIRDADTEQNLGIVVVSAPVAETLSVISETMSIYVFVALIVLLLLLITVSFFTRNLVRPLRDMAAAARQFGHGNLKARVDTGGNNTQEIDEVAIAFNNMATSLEKSEYQRQEFVANVSHELKTPMTTIGGYVDGILDGTIPLERQRHYMRLVSDETKRLSRLVRSMLDISRLQDGGIPAEKKSRFDVCESMGMGLINFEQKINDKHLQVDVKFPEHEVFTWADPDAITQVIYNLIDNAVKFCADGGELGLRIREGGGKVFVSVSNTGATIPPEELPLVFDRFHKIDKSRSLNRDGWGLGLYIVKTIVCSHGEDISVSSREGKTEFTFTLPRVN